MEVEFGILKSHVPLLAKLFSLFLEIYYFVIKKILKSIILIAKHMYDKGQVLA
jgi:F0F1-type ATP synthase epsilon subunit